MERHDLEQRIRTSLHERAGDVEPTPELWEEVSTRTARRSRWQLGLWALSGAAAVAAIVVVGVSLLGGPGGVEIDQEPDVVESPETPSPSDSATPGPGSARGAPTVVTTDGTTLYRIDPSTGAVQATLDPFEGFAEGAAIREVAVRPVGEAGTTTVATVIEIEGGYDVEVSVFDASGQRVDRQRVGVAAMEATDLPPDLVWSEDGRYVMWAGSSVIGGTVAGPALWAYDWQERAVDENGVAEPFTVASGGALFERGDVVDLRAWTGPSQGESTVLATTTTGGAFRVDLSATPSDCGGARPCPPTFSSEVSDLGFEGMSAFDLGTLDSGVQLALVSRAGQPGDAEGTTVALVADPMSDQQRELDVPQLTSGSASPLDAWMAVAGDRVAVGFGPQAAYLLTVEGETTEQTEVTGTVDLPDGSSGAGAAVATLASRSETPSESPAAPAAAVGEDGLPLHVVSHYPSADQFLLQDRRADDPVVTWARPDGVPGDLDLNGTVVWPGSTPDRLEVVTTWGEPGEVVLARTVVVQDAVTTNAAFPDDLQPAPGGEALARPVFDPNGNYLAWIEPADGGQAIRAVRWQNGSPSSDQGATALDGQPPLGVLSDWAFTLDRGAVMTALPADPAATELVEIPLLGTDGPVVVAPDGPTVRDLPGAPLAAGSFTFEDGSTRYVVYDDGGVRYGLADAPETAVPTPLDTPEDGRVVGFGPDSLVVQGADGTWGRVQVDDGATSSVEVPGGAVAFLPWSDPRG